MKRAWIVSLGIVAIVAGAGRAQVSGNVGFAQPGVGGRARAEQAERARRTVGQFELPPSGSSTYVEASILMNVKADEYVAVFGVVEEGDTPEDCGRKMDATIRKFTEALEALKLGKDDFYVDFIAQNRIYGFELSGDVAREKLVGF